MVVSLDEAQRLEGADVFDSKGQLIGTVRAPHVLDGELMGLHVDLDPTLAELPTVGRDSIEISPDHVTRSGERTLRLTMELMDAVDAKAPTRERTEG